MIFEINFASQLDHMLPLYCFIYVFFTFLSNFKFVCISNLQVDMSSVSFVDGGFFTMHEVPNSNVFIIIKNNQQPTYDSCFCGIIKVGLTFFP